MFKKFSQGWWLFYALGQSGPITREFNSIKFLKFNLWTRNENIFILSGPAIEISICNSWRALNSLRRIWGYFRTTFHCAQSLTNFYQFSEECVTLLARSVLSGKVYIQIQILHLEIFQAHQKVKNEHSTFAFAQQRLKLLST